MSSIILDLDSRSSKSLYIQIYEQLKGGIVSGDIKQGTKLPSLRKLAKEHGISTKTIEAAYEQLMVEGYITSRPKSGFYVSDDIAAAAESAGAQDEGSLREIMPVDGAPKAREMGMLYDEKSFEFAKWKRCMNKVFNEYSYMLQNEADVQGEAALRYEIAKYLGQSRGVKCKPSQIVVGAGSQQLTTHLIRILKELGMSHAATETPGYGPIRDIFKEKGFSMSYVPVDGNGIVIEKLPVNLKTVVYVTPSNQFPSGAVMPIARRYELIKWAVDNDSYIFEDDYDSELRYFGKPVPALKGLDTSGRVIYLGSFSSTLFASIKISYMVLPDGLVEIFDRFKSKYSQTCSKAEQLCLALYMEEGYYLRNIKKCRNLYADKLENALALFKEYGDGIVEAVDSRSGMTLVLKVRSDVSAEKLCAIAKNLGLDMHPVDDLCTGEEQVLSFYFYRVSGPLLKILIRQFVQNVKKESPKHGN